MSCVGCQKRREAITRIAAKVGGTIVFGARRVLTKQDPPKQQEARRGKPGT